MKPPNEVQAHRILRATPTTLAPVAKKCLATCPVCAGRLTVGRWVDCETVGCPWKGVPYAAHLAALMGELEAGGAKL